MLCTFVSNYTIPVFVMCYIVCKVILCFLYIVYMNFCTFSPNLRIGKIETVFDLRMVLFIRMFWKRTSSGVDPLSKPNYIFSPWLKFLILIMEFHSVWSTQMD